jgi:AcrR family transcriptional regulator
VTSRGRRPGAPRTRETILEAARRRFAAAGYEASSLRAIAADAGVDPALVVHYFGSKDRLFVAALQLPEALPAVLAATATGRSGSAVEALLRAFLALVDSDPSRNAMLALVRSAVSNEGAAAMLREYFAAELLPGVAALSPAGDAPLRASLVASQLIGLAAARHVVRLAPLASAEADVIVSLMVPAMERYLVPEAG